MTTFPLSIADRNRRNRLDALRRGEAIHVVENSAAMGTWETGNFWPPNSIRVRGFWKSLGDEPTKSTEARGQGACDHGVREFGSPLHYTYWANFCGAGNNAGRASGSIKSGRVSGARYRFAGVEARMVGMHRGASCNVCEMSGHRPQTVAGIARVPVHRGRRSTTYRHVWKDPSKGAHLCFDSRAGGISLAGVLLSNINADKRGAYKILGCRGPFLYFDPFFHVCGGYPNGGERTADRMCMR